MLKSKEEWTSYIARCMTGECDIWVARNWRPGDRGIVAYSKFEKSKLLIHCMLVRGECILDARGSLPLHGDLPRAVSEMLVGSSAESRQNCFFTVFDRKELFVISMFIEHHRLIPKKYSGNSYSHMSLDISDALQSLPEYKITVQPRTATVKIPLSEQIDYADSKLSISGFTSHGNRDLGER